MIKIDKRSFDNIMMTARATDTNGATIKVSMTYALGNGLSAYDKTNGRWLNAGEWEWVNV